MDEEGIGVVLARATELRLKISNCIHKATPTSYSHSDPLSSSVEEDDKQVTESEEKEPEQHEEDDGAERLFHICDALEALENQLNFLQALQQEQQYEREAALAQIDHGRKMLLDKLKEYGGEDLEVIHEASAFAGETIEHDNNLLLPPYPNRLPHSLVLDNGYLLHFPSTLKSIRNGVITSDQTNVVKKNLSQSRRNQTQTGLGCFINVATKTVVTLVGVISVLRLAGVGPRLSTRDIPWKILSLFQQPATEEKRSTVLCPPGKVLVMEDGKARCLVKERVEVPFESVVSRPDVNYGCG